MGRRKGRRSETEKDDEILSANIVEEGEESEGDGEGNGNGKFFACYLLTSLSPRFKGHCYIGFTVNPRRRIRQHNGEITSGATRTKKRRPWEMVLCIYGFSTNVAALQFEWAWQHPVESLAVRQAAATFKSLSGIANKIKLAYTMLNLPSWRSLNLTVNYFSTKYMKHMANCPTLPEQMKVQVCTIDELPLYIGGSSCVEQDDELLDPADEDCEQSGESQESMENSSADAQTLKDVILLQDDVEHSRAEQGGGCRKRTFLEQLNNSPPGEKLCKRSFKLNRNPVTEPSLSFSSGNKITTNAEDIGIFDSPDELLRQPKNLGIGEKEVHKQSFQLNACPVRAPSVPVSSCNNMATIAEDNEIFRLPDELLRQPKSLGVVENEIRKQSFQPNGFPVRAPSLSVFSCNKEATNAEDGGIFGLPNEYIDEYDHMGKQQIPENTVPNKDQCPSTSSEVVVIDAFTPSPYFKANKRSKKPRFSEAEIIDLTNSPLFV